ncbi:CotS family spore coat protein [Alkaliphilus hydrothermalis]|uniref:Spore coat-associated protein S n=1 Tax=Alkaliphilus hydrothermalis TaxID=1482730 RepID=A0ABS2NR88_9FIRM|nr:CotS family spore coat protein [Alkaliphilus hydrothermalis]MBM7615473.1 spore coat-associated protein S [Alkaliphilus hydrothermalis]
MQIVETKELNPILSQYSFEIDKVQLVADKVNRSVWKIYTNDGIKYLKKIQYPLEKIQFLVDAIKHLQSNHFPVPIIHTTNNQVPYCIIGDDTYLLTDQVIGSKPNLDSISDFRRVTTSLAKFHLASRGVIPKPQWAFVNSLGNWSEFFREKYDLLNSIYQESDTKTTSTLDKLFVRKLPKFINNLTKLQQQLLKSEYHLWTKDIEKVGGLCHCDFSPSNLIIHPSGKVYIIDFDTLSIDLPAKDFRILLYWTLIKKGSFDKNEMMEFLELYQQHNPLTPQQWEIIKIYLLYPYMLIYAIENCSRRQWNESVYLSRVVKGIETDQEMLRLIPFIDSFIKNTFH